MNHTTKHGQRVLDNPPIEILGSPNSNPPIRLVEIPSGQPFTGKVGMYTGLFLRTHSQVVDLSHPNRTWTVGRMDSPGGAKCYNYTPVSISIRIDP